MPKFSFAHTLKDEPKGCPARHWFSVRACHPGSGRTRRRRCVASSGNALAQDLRDRHCDSRAPRSQYMRAHVPTRADSCKCSFSQHRCRLARWLLMTRDRSHSNSFFLTHEFLSLSLSLSHAWSTTGGGFDGRELVAGQRLDPLPPRQSHGLAEVGPRTDFLRLLSPRKGHVPSHSPAASNGASSGVLMCAAVPTRSPLWNSISDQIHRRDT